MTPQDNTRHIYYEEDFAILCRFPEGIPAYPWRMVFNTTDNPGYDYICSFDGENYLHAHPERDAVVLEFRRHRLRCGALSYIFRRTVPNELFTDGEQDRATPILANVELWGKPSDDEQDPYELLAVIGQVIKGDRGAKGDAGEMGIQGESGESGPQGIPGDRGKDGHTPIKGVDYFTPAEVGQVAAEAAGLVPVPDVGEAVAASIHASALCFDRAQSLTVPQQEQALSNAGLNTVIVQESELPKVLTDKQATRIETASAVLLSGSADGDRLYCRGDVYKEYIYFYLLRTSAKYNYVRYDGATRQLETVVSGNLRDVDAVHYFPDNKTEAQRRTARVNIAAVGYLCLSASQGAEGDNYALTLRSTLSEVQAAYSLFWTDPGRSRWSLSVYEPGEQNPFIEEAELEPLQVNDGLELLFTSKRSGRRYAVVLTVADSAVTAVRTEYRIRPDQHIYAEAGAAYDPQTGYWALNGLDDLTDGQIAQSYAQTSGLHLGSTLYGALRQASCRTNFPIRNSSFIGRAGFTLTQSFCDMQLEVLNLMSENNTGFGYLHSLVAGTLMSNPRLRRIIGVITFTGSNPYISTNSFNDCPLLEQVEFNMMARQSLNFGDRNVSISAASIQFVIDNAPYATGAAGITLSVAGAVYDRLTDQIKAAGAAKNISIASI